MSEDISDSILMARKPIFDKDLNIVAYELLFHSSTVNESGVDEFNGDSATTHVINNTFMELGIEKVIEDKCAFITGEIPLTFGSNNVVLEVLEDTRVNDD